LKGARDSAGWRIERLPTLKAREFEVSCIARRFGLSDSEFDRYVNIGLITISPVNVPASAERAASFTVQLGNKELTVGLHDNQAIRYTMRYLRGKKSGALSCK
jgi:hypothetical protein